MVTFKKVVLFGSNGQIGEPILEALANCKTQSFDITAVISPNADQPSASKSPNVTVQSADIFKKQDLVPLLKNADVVISALNGKGLEAQALIQDVAAEAGVKRFYPSEYGMHHIYRKPGDDTGHVHPMWDQKALINERAVRHPAIASGAMSYTMIGCGDFYNQPREPVWCPWSQKDVESYTFHILGSADAKADFTHTHDFARYLVASLCAPDVSHNAELNFTSEHISHTEIAALLEKHSGKKVEMLKISDDDKWAVVEDPKKAPKEQTESAFPVDFWYLVKGTQGDGAFWRPPGQVHNHLFPDVQVTTFDMYFKEMFGKSSS